MSSACGSQTLSKGKHAGLSYSDCLANDPGYCSFVLARAAQMGPAYHGFVDYLRSQAEQPEGRAADPPASEVPAEADGGYRYQGAPAPDALGEAQTSDAATGGDGEAVVGFGKHRGLTFRQLIAQEPDYCRWIAREAAAREERGEPHMETFAALIGYIRAGAAGGAPAATSRQPYRQQGSVAYGGGSADLEPRDRAIGDLVSGKWQVAFGNKYKDRTFDEVVVEDKHYCSFILDQVLQSPTPRGANMTAFALYVQYVMFRDATGS